MGQFKVTVRYIITASKYSDKGTPTQYIVSLDEDKFVAPQFVLKPSDNLAQMLGGIVEHYIDVHPKWMPLKVYNVLQKEDELAIIYGCQIPIDTGLFDGAKWCPLSIITTEQDLQYALEIIRAS
jgi:hypothetical protein